VIVPSGAERDCELKEVKERLRPADFGVQSWRTTAEQRRSA
jgi:hypothetical protein